ncbi:hypothetical protein SNEBB_008588 [Seison nebaliae]|nr:hypothetical protein SNEBB_008588 [Seison nebaliae]
MPTTNDRNKILLMGKSGAGKTSMRTIIFSNFLAHEARRLGITIEIEQAFVRFYGKLVLNVWDCGGQKAFLDNYVDAQRGKVFGNVEVLIYVFEVRTDSFDKQKKYFLRCLECVEAMSPETKVYVLIHKMDLIENEKQNKEFRGMRDDIKAAVKGKYHKEIKYFATTIWNESLYLAWSAILHDQIKDIDKIEKLINRLLDVLDAEEIILLEKCTLLVIASVHINSKGEKKQNDLKKNEQISDMVKKFKVNCRNMNTLFLSIEYRNNDRILQKV